MGVFFRGFGRLLDRGAHEDLRGVLPIEPKVILYSLVVIPILIVCFLLFFRLLLLYDLLKALLLLLFQFGQFLHEDIDLLHIDHQLMRIFLIISRHLRLVLITNLMKFLLVGHAHEL
jgi:hypothetical protein